MTEATETQTETKPETNIGIRAEDEIPTIEIPTIHEQELSPPESAETQSDSAEEIPARKPRKTRQPKPPLDNQNFAPNETFDLPPVKKRKKASGNAKTLSSVLAVLHSTVFSVIGATHLDLSADENLALASALDSLAEEYEVTVDSKTAAWMNLAMVAGSIYGSRAFLIYQQKQLFAQNEKAN